METEAFKLSSASEALPLQGAAAGEPGGVWVMVVDRVL